MQHESTFNFVQAVLAEAMRKRLMISAVYNSSALTLAPHQIVLRNEMILASAGDLLSLFIGLETMSLGVYAMVGFRRGSMRSTC